MHCLQDALVDVQRPLLAVFGWLKGARGTSKTWIPYSTSIKNRGFKVSTWKTPLGRALEALWISWECPRSLSSRPFGGPMANLTGGRAGEIHFFSATAGVPTISCFRRPSREAFGQYLISLLYVPRCFFLLLGVEFLEFLERTSVVVVLPPSDTPSGHFASSLRPHDVIGISN